MKKVFKILGVLVVLVLLFVAGAAIYIKNFLPNVGPAPELKVVSTPEKVERGKYLANHVMICMDCHSTRMFDYFGAPMDMNTLGMGGDVFDQNMGFPGRIVAANITPTGIGDWTDGELFRAITTGVRKSGKPIFPVMPYHNYGKIDTEDIEAIIAYVRTLSPNPNKPDESTYDFPMNFIINTIPTKSQFSKRPSPSDRLAYGKYMVTAASCGECHTPFDKGEFDETKRLAGGRIFELPGGTLISANLTSDKETGMGNLSKEEFIGKFAAYRDSTYAHRKINFMADFATIMPWPMYSGMTDDDLSAIYEYLQTVPAISNKNVKFTPRK